MHWKCCARASLRRLHTEMRKRRRTGSRSCRHMSLQRRRAFGRRFTLRRGMRTRRLPRGSSVRRSRPMIPIRFSCGHGFTLWKTSGYARWRCSRRCCSSGCPRLLQRRHTIWRGSARAFSDVRQRLCTIMHRRAMPRRSFRCVRSTRAMCSLIGTISPHPLRRIAARQRNTARSLQMCGRLRTKNTIGRESGGSASGIFRPMCGSMSCSPFRMR